MARPGRQPKCPPREGTPSWTLTNLVGLGTSAKQGYLLARGPHPTPTVAATLRREAESRAEAYDRELGMALEYVAVVRERMGEPAAQVVEERFIDGSTWRQLAQDAGITPAAALGIASKALRMLDAEAGEGESES